MKQIELAQQLGISKSYLSMILSGQRTPKKTCPAGGRCRCLGCDIFI